MTDTTALVAERVIADMRADVVREAASARRAAGEGDASAKAAKGAAAEAADHRTAVAGAIAAATAYVAPSALDLPETCDAADVRALPDGSRLARVLDHGERIDIRLVPGDSPMGVKDSNAPAELEPFVGQSKAGPDDDGVSDILGALFPHTVLALKGLGEIGGGYARSEADFTGFEPLADLAGNFPATIAAWAEEQFCLDAGEPRPTRVPVTSWKGGAALSLLQPGSIVWRNTSLAARQSKALMMRLYGRRLVCRAFGLDHGESGLLEGANAARFDRAAYAAALTALCDAQRAELREALGQSDLPTALIVQIAQSAAVADSEPGLNEIRLAQLDVHEARGNTGIMLALPDHPHRIHVEGEGVHRDFVGTALMGETYGLCRFLLKRGRFSGAMRPLSLTRTGARIEIDFHCPEGVPVFDDSFIAPVAQEGFRFGRLGTAIPLLAAPEPLEGTAKVRFDLAENPGGETLVEFAIDNEAPSGGVWSIGRGTLMCQSRQKSAVRRWAERYGFDLPATYPEMLRHHCVAFAKNAA